MRVFTSCLALQLRLAGRRLWALLAMALVAVALCGAAAVAGRVAFSGHNFTGVNLAVATEDGDERIATLVDLLGGLQDVSEFATIHQVAPAEAEDMVRRGDAAVAVVLPEGFMDSVLAGDNLSPRLLVDASRPLEMMLVTKLAESATRMLTRAQQGITFVLEVYDAQNPGDEGRGRVVQDANLAYATWVLGRSSMFRALVANPTGTLTIPQFYLLAAALYLAALAVPVLYRVYAFSAQGGWPARLRAAGCPLWMWAACSVLAGALALFVMLAVLLAGIAVVGGGAAVSPALVAGLALCALGLSAFGFLCCNTGSILAAVSLDFLLATAALLVGGGLVPAVLLPGGLAALAPFSPMGWMHDALAPLFGAAVQPLALLLVGGFALLLAGGCLLLGRLRERRPG